jgi:membrane associated rhomboid family serine protease
MSLAYSEFLSRASAGLVSAGAHHILPLDGNGGTATWPIGWDQTLLLQEPGLTTIYSFTRADSSDPREVRARVDALARSLADRGILTGSPMRLVTIAAFQGGLDQSAGRSVSRLAPSTYYSGLKPSTWAVDLQSGRVYTPGFLGAPDGSDVIRQSADAASGGATPMPSEVEAARQRQSERLGAFFSLVQGRRPIVTYALIAINVLIFALLYKYGGAGGNESESTLVNSGALVPQLVENGQWWRLFTVMFLHANVEHILFNMTSLFAVGTLAERFYGSVRYLAIYLGSGLIGAVTSVAYFTLIGQPTAVGVGASGAIFGVAGALITLRFQHSEVIPRRLRERVSSSMIPLVVISLPLSYILAPNVDNSAHIGGLLGGMLLSFVFPITDTVPAGSAIR